jgi:hypothetical protein
MTAGICQLCKAEKICVTPFRVCEVCGKYLCKYCFNLTKEGKVYCDKCKP